MADINCNACEEIRQNAPNLIVNGLGDTECASLANDYGLALNDDRDDCDDLKDLNDCLIGNMAQEVDAYDVCDWKTFVKGFIENLWTTIKAVICAVCGLWTNVHSIWKAIEDIRCEIAYLYNGASFEFGETTSAGKQSVLVPGTGVDFGIRQAGQAHTSDIVLWYIAGGLARISGSLRLFTESFKNVDLETKSGNAVWNFSNPNFSLPKGGELLFEVRIKKSEFTQIKSIFDGDAFYTGGGNKFYHARIGIFNEGKYAYGQHGWCDDDGSPSESGYSSGHLVPSGWTYVQFRLMDASDNAESYNVKDGSGADKLGADLTLGGYMGIRMNKDKIDC